MCGERIEVTLPYDYSYVHYRNAWYHTDCFTASTTPRVLKNDWFSKTKDYVQREVSKDNIDRLFKKHYNVSLIPQYIYIKLDSIYKGTFKGLAQPIPPHELLDILERKMDYLDKNATRKNLSGISRINYDLAVACGSYKSYKEWQASLQAEQEQAKQEAEERKGYSYKLRGYVPSEESEKEDTFIDLDEE